jgi:glycosyltransferase involved in cell wall biosynthesis
MTDAGASCADHGFRPISGSMQARCPPCVLCVSPVLPQDVRHQCQALNDAGLLDKVVCSVAYAEGGRIEKTFRLLDRALGTQTLRGTERRRFGAVSPNAIYSRWWPELSVRLAGRLRLLPSGPSATDRYLGQIDRAASRHVKPAIKLVIGREDGCLRTFEAAKRVGATCLYDLPTTYYAKVRAIMEREALEFPGASSQDGWEQEYRPARNDRKDSELRAADHVLVPSQFVRTSLIDAGIPADRISAIPFGCQPLQARLQRQPSSGDKKVLLCAGHLSVRKGTPRLLRAWKRLGAYRTHSLRLIGSMHLSPRFFSEYEGLVEYVPQMPRAELSKHYATSYAFVMPAAAEGFAVVITEALSHGLPVVASENSGAAGFMTHEREGLLYPFEDEGKLCAAIDHMLSHPEQVAEMSRAASALAERWTWKHYRAAFLSLIEKLSGYKDGTT